MKQIEIFTLARHTGPYDKWPLHTEIIKDGTSTGKKIPGYVIEAQYQHQKYYLLVTSWDCPFEEAQTFLLLSQKLKVKAEKTVGAAYASVWMEGHRPQGTNSVLFNCDGDLDVLATITEKGRLKLKKLDRKTGRRWLPMVDKKIVIDFFKMAVLFIILCFCYIGITRFLAIP